MYLNTIRYKQFDCIEIKESCFKEFYLPVHFHDTYCIGLLSQGFKKANIGENSLIIHSNCVSIVNPYQVHSDENYNDEPSIYKMIYINKDALHFIAHSVLNQNLNSIEFTNELISDNLLNLIVQKFFDPFIQDPINLEKNLFDLIKLLVENYQSNTVNNLCDHKLTLNSIEDSIQFAHRHFNQKIDLDKMAAQSKLSKFQFIRYFKKQTGLTPASYIIVCRINHAKSLMLKGAPIGLAALEAGFYDHPQYCKFFKYFTGLSPIEYQKSYSVL